MFEKLGRSLDEFIHNVGTDTKMTRIDLKTEPISIPYPETETAALRLELGVGILHLKRGGDKLVDGTVVYNVDEWKPEITTEAGRVLIRQHGGAHIIGNWDKVRNEWDLALGSARPFSLSIGKGVGESYVSLGAVPFEDFRLETGAGESTISFDEPNPRTAGEFSARFAAGKTAISGLLNANASRVSVEGGAGEVTLNFTGAQLQQDMAVNVQIGAGELRLGFKRGIPVSISVNKALGDIQHDGNFVSTSRNSFETAGYALASGHKLTVKVSAAIGSVVLSELD